MACTTQTQLHTCATCSTLGALELARQTRRIRICSDRARILRRIRGSWQAIVASTARHSHGGHAAGGARVARLAGDAGAAGGTCIVRIVRTGRTGHGARRAAAVVAQRAVLALGGGIQASRLAVRASWAGVGGEQRSALGTVVVCRTRAAVNCPGGWAVGAAVTRLASGDTCLCRRAAAVACVCRNV